MRGLRGKLSDNLMLCILASFVFMSVLGMGVGMGITDGQMSSCPFMVGQNSMCEMSVMGHIAQWQRAFLGIPKKMNLLALAAVLLATALIPFAKLFFKLEELTELAVRLFAYLMARIVKVFDPLLLAFSDGILNPKIYEPARI